MNNKNSVFVITSVLLLSSFMIPINDAFAATTFVDAFDISSQETDPRGLAFNTDGTKMFVTGDDGNDVNEYACTTGFDVSTCSFTDAFSVQLQEINPMGVAFNTDGTKMFVLGSSGDDVNEYACTTGFDVSTCSFTDAFSVQLQEINPKGLAFNTDGTKMFVIGTGGDDVNEYACTAFDVSTCSFTDAFSISSQETSPTGLAFNTDGTKMFVVGGIGDDINEYACTAFDVSTCSFTDAFSISGQETNPTDVAFNTDGTKMFVLGAIGDDVNEYTLEVGFDFDASGLGTTTFVDAFDISSQEASPQGVAFNSDGTKMFVTGNDGDDVNEYACSAFDVSTCSFTDAFDVSGQDTYPADVAFNSDGTKMFVLGSSGNDVNEYACTAFDVSTCSFTDAFSISSQESAPRGLAFNTDGTKMFVTGLNGDDVNEYACTTGFDVSTCSFTDRFSVSAQSPYPAGLTFNTDGTKMFVVDTPNVHEYACTAFDVSTCSFTDAILISAQSAYATGLAFNTDGTKMFVTGTAGEDVDEYTLEVGFDFDGVSAAEESTKKKSSSDCYDCKPPVLQSSHITILTNDYVVATGDSPLHITANVGDKISVTLKITDNKSVDTIPFAGLYTNYQDKPSDMNLFYANNYDKWKHVSTSFYEWNVRADDVPYDYDGTVSWSDNVPTVVTDVITEDNYFMINDDNILEYFMIPFTFTMNDSMEQSTITAKIYDASGNRLHVTLPVTLETAGNEPPDFDYTGKQKVLGFYDESVLSEMISQWSESESDTKQLSSLLGISDESLLPWTSNLATWVTDDKIDSADMIIAIEYLINQ